MYMKKIIFFILFLCSSLAFAINMNSVTFEQSQKILIEDTINQVDQMIQDLIVLPTNQRKRIATAVAIVSRINNIDPRIMLAIIKVESSFNQHAKSPTNDFSIAQINYKVWSKSFPKLKFAPLNINQLKEDEIYAIYRMGEILGYIKKERGLKDKYWFAEYHSSTPKYKNQYIKLLKPSLKKIIKYKIKNLELIPTDPNYIAEIFNKKDLR